MQNNLLSLKINSQSKQTILGLLSLALVLLVGCTNVPMKDFSAYKEAFDQARKASEQVLYDYAAAKKEFDALGFKKSASDKPIRQQKFDTDKIAAAADPVDDVAIRLRAWEVTALYNKVLTDLAEGKPAEQVAGAMEGLVDSLANFPVKAFQNVASELTPVTGILTTVLTEIQRDYDRRRVIDAMVEVSPKISEGLIGNMMKDSISFYNIRFALNNIKFQQTLADIANTQGEFVKLAESMTAEARDRDAIPLIKVINKRLAAGPKNARGKTAPPIKLRDPTGTNAGPLTTSQLTELKNKIFALVENAENKNKELAAYQDMLSAYVRMLAQVDTRLKALVQAAQTEKTNPPQNSDFIYSIIRVRQAYLAYQDSKK